MKTEIYYFTGTGNSLSVARDIAACLDGHLLSIASFNTSECIHVAADSLGIVFPCYMAQKYGIPLIVQRFIQKIENLDQKYIFAVCTCGGWELVNALPTLRRLAKVIERAGGKLAGEFAVKLPMNNLAYPSPLISQNQNLMFLKAGAKIQSICRLVSLRKKNKFKAVKILFNLLMTPLYALVQNLYVVHLRKMSKEPKETKLTYFELIHLSDKSIAVNNKCNGCGICTKICPVGNIKLIEQRPVWQHQCEMCLACDEWCPQRAIHHWCKTEGKDYHHPKIKLSDLI